MSGIKCNSLLQLNGFGEITLIKGSNISFFKSTFCMVYNTLEWRKEKKMHFNPATMGRLPFSYFFPERLKGAKLAKKLKFEGTVEVNDNFIFIHDCFFRTERDV